MSFHIKNICIKNYHTYLHIKKLSPISLHRKLLSKLWSISKIMIHIFLLKTINHIKELSKKKNFNYIKNYDPHICDKNY